MLMPETPVNEDDLSMPWKNQIGPSGQVFPMQTEAIPHSLYKRTHDQFRPRVLALDRGHATTTLLWSQNIGHAMAIRISSMN
jgi:hypothetical protein